MSRRVVAALLALLPAAPAAAEPGVTGPRLPALDRAIVTTGVERLAISDEAGALYLCDLANGACLHQPEASAHPRCITHLRNGWFLAWPGGVPLCAAACRGAPPLPDATLQALRTLRPDACGNAPGGAAWWLDAQHLTLLTDPDAALQRIPLPPAPTPDLRPPPPLALSTPARLYFTHADRLRARAFDAPPDAPLEDLTDLSPAASLWPTTCPPDRRRLDQLLYIPPRSRDAVHRGGVWALSLCGLMPAHLFNIETGADAPIALPVPIPADVAPLTGALAVDQTLWLALPVSSASPHQLWRTLSDRVFVPFTPPLPRLAVLADASGVPLALGEGVTDLRSRRRVGLTHGDGQPFGAARLRTALDAPRGPLHAVVTTDPAGVWLWSPRSTRPQHVHLPGNAHPDAVRDIKLVALGGPILTYDLNGTWHEQPLDLKQPPRLRSLPPGLPEGDASTVNGVALAAALTFAALLLVSAILIGRRRREPPPQA